MAERLPSGIALRAHLVDDEQVLGAFLGIRGPRPGVEVLVCLPAMLALLITGRSWTWPVVLGVGIAVVAGRRRYVTVVRTDQAVVRIEQGRSTKLQPGATAARLPITAIGFVDDSGDARVLVESEWFWLLPDQRDTAYRLSRIPPPPTIV